MQMLGLLIRLIRIRIRVVGQLRLTGQRRPDHYMFPGFPDDRCLFGRRALEKRRREAKEIDMPLKRITHTELGVCLGYSRSS